MISPDPFLVFAFIAYVLAAAVAFTRQENRHRQRRRTLALLEQRLAEAVRTNKRLADDVLHWRTCYANVVAHEYHEDEGA